jgi:UDP-glucose 4-epimerase
MCKLLITGALGYIGSRFIRQLPVRVHEVLLLDNLLSQRYASLFNLPPLFPFRFCYEDVCSADLDKYFEGVDVVIHLAAISGAAETFNKQKELEQINYLGTRRVAEACARQGCKLLFVSTTSIYSGCNGEVVDEQCLDRLRPQTPYAESKLRAERLLQTFGEKHDLPFIICRFGSVFGPSVGMRFDTAINKFTWQACVGQPLTVWCSALDQQRPYLHLHDAVRALNFILSKELFDGQVYNVVTLNTTVRQVVDVLSTCIPHVQIKLVDSPAMNDLSFQVSSERLCRLGFDFRGCLNDGIEKTVRLFNPLTHHSLINV